MRYKYYAFISYKREDEYWAKWLQEKLEYFKIPSSSDSDITDENEYIRPVFRDATDLRPGLLSERIEEALDQSRFLIAICSPRYSKSIWCDAEVRRFIDTNKSRNIIPFIIDGVPYANDETECFPPSLQALKGGPHELLGADIHPMGNEYAFVQVVASMLELNVDVLWKRHLRNEEQEKIKLKAEKDRLLALQSRIVAEKAKGILTGWPFDKKKAAAIVREVLPNDVLYPDRPWTTEAECVLRMAVTDEIKLIEINDEGHILCYNDDIVVFYCTTPSNELPIRIHSIKTNDLICELSGHTTTVLTAAISSDGKMMTTVSSDSVKLWNLNNHTLIFNKICIKHLDKLCVFSNDGTWLVIASGQYLELFNTKSKKREFEIRAHASRINSIKFSEDGKYLLTSSLDNCVKIWDSSNFTEISVIRFDAIVTCASFKCDSSSIISALSYKDKTSATGGREVIKMTDIKGHTNLLTNALTNLEARAIGHIFYNAPTNELFIDDVCSNIIFIYDISSWSCVFEYHYSGSGSRHNHPFFSLMRVNSKGKSVDIARAPNKLIRISIPSRTELIEKTKAFLEGYTLSEYDKKQFYIE